MTLKVVELKKSQNQGSVISTLEEMMERAKSGEIDSVEIVFSISGGGWGTTASTGVDCRSSAAMLMELAMRRLGFDHQS